MYKYILIILLWIITSCSLMRANYIMEDDKYRNLIQDSYWGMMTGFSSKDSEKYLLKIADKLGFSLSWISIQWRINYYANNGKDIIAYEYIVLNAKRQLQWGIYEVLLPAMTVSNELNTWFYTPWFLLAWKLANLSWTWKNMYFHSGKVRRISDWKEFYLTNDPIQWWDTQHDSWLKKAAEMYFTTGSYIEKNMVIADPRSYRVYNPMPGSINIYSELFSESTH